MKRTIKVFIYSFFVLWLFCGLAAAIPLEITTGSGASEGIKNVDGSWVKDGSLIQVIKLVNGEAGQKELLVGVTSAGYNFPFDHDQGKFDDHFMVSAGDRIFVRAFDAEYAGDAKWFGDSAVYTVSGYRGECWNINGDKDIPAFDISREIK